MDLSWCFQSFKCWNVPANACVFDSVFAMRRFYETLAVQVLMLTVILVQHATRIKLHSTRDTPQIHTCSMH